MAKKPGPQPKYDWLVIEEKYVQGVEKEGKRNFPTLDELAELHGVHRSTMRRQAADGGWSRKRDEFAAKVAQAKSEKVVKELAERAASFDLECLRIAEHALKRGVALLAGKRILAANPADNSKIAAFELAPSDYANVMNGLKTAQAMGRLALGEATDHTKHSGEVDPGAGGLSGLLKAALADGTD